MVKTTIQDQIKNAMRAKEALRLETLRYLLSQIKYEEIAKQRELTDEEVIDIFLKEAKKRKEAIELFRSSGRNELVTEEEQKLRVITDLLPAQMSEAELGAIIDAAIASSSEKTVGSIMRIVLPMVKGKADGKLVSTLVASKLSAL